MVGTPGPGPKGAGQGGRGRDRQPEGQAEGSRSAAYVTGLTQSFEALLKSSFIVLVIQ